ncbi:MAG: MarR family transcriptional regulator [Ktedonobacterales bacterium]|nr:MarR family transcriptional regulator [Ktedonobacterales bacterium]
MSSTDDAAVTDDHEQRTALIDQLQLLGEAASTETALFHQAAAAKYGLGITDMKTLSIVLREGPQSAGQIAKRLSLTTGAVTSVIDRLERQGLVRREPDPHDRRKVIVMVNQQNLAHEDNIYQSMGAAFEHLLRQYSTAELAFLVRFYEASIDLTKHEMAKLAAPERHGDDSTGN